MRRRTLAKALDQILAEIDAGYNPQRQSIQARLDALPAQADSEIAGLKATQEQAFTDILGGARDRGMGFSGVPLAEQSRYTASQFLPAVARVRQSQNESKQSLFDALNNINLDQRKYATSLYQQELDRDEQIRQYNETLAESKRQAAAAQKSLPSPSFGASGPTAATPQMGRKQDGGFAFVDANGQPISAARYAQATGQPIGNVLYAMGQQGDTYAQQLYNQLKNDPSFGRGNAAYDTRIKAAYAPIFWGT